MRLSRFTGYLVAALTLTFACQLTICKPLDADDVASLIPDPPRTTNDTLEAVVADPVIRDAVGQALGSNGSLTGLVVRRTIVVKPASDPDQIISEDRQVLKVPEIHLEDVRRNVTGDLFTEEPPIESLVLGPTDELTNLADEH